MMNKINLILFSLAILSSFSFVDALGQDRVSTRKIHVEYQKMRDLEFTGWESSETLVFDSLSNFVPKAIEMTSWGGRKDLPLPDSIIGQEGYFRVAKVDGRWYFVDPDDGMLIIMGTQSLGECGGVANGQQWAEETADLLRKNGFNNIHMGYPLGLKHYTEVMPAGVGETILNYNNQKLSYVDIAFMLRSFAWSIKLDEKNFNRLMAVFHPDYLTFIDEYARKNSEKIRDDKHCVGYYIDNELNFLGWRKMFASHSIKLQNFLGIADSKNPVELPSEYVWAKNAALHFLEERGVALENITDEDDDAFRAYVADYYYKTTTEALRRHDPNHLILGNRLHGFSKYDNITIAACARWCDVISINYYNVWEPEKDYLENLKKWTNDKPFMITEFYVKSDDATYNGTPYQNKEGGGWLVRNQVDRGRFYQNFTLGLLRSPNCIGWTHFKYNDVVYKSKDGKTAYCNKGIVDLEYKPYTIFLEHVKQIHQNVYSLVDYLDNTQTRDSVVAKD